VQDKVSTRHVLVFLYKHILTTEQVNVAPRAEGTDPRAGMQQRPEGGSQIPRAIGSCCLLLLAAGPLRRLPRLLWVSAGLTGLLLWVFGITGLLWRISGIRCGRVLSWLNWIGSCNLAKDIICNDLNHVQNL
jgi:hypothetical protein